MYEYYTDIPYASSITSDVLRIILIVLGIFLIFSFVVLIFKIIYNWVLFKKMGREGWEGIIPLYNKIIEIQILDIPMWMVILLFIPPFTIIPLIAIDINVAKKFGKDTGFALGLIFLPIIFYPILAFGSSEFNSELPGVFETNNLNNNIKYCTNCGTKVSGKYCTNCGEKIEA